MYEVASCIPRVIHPGQDVDKTRRFAGEVLERAYVAAQEFAGMIAEHPIDGLRSVAISAAHDAENREEFEDEIRRILDVRLGVIPDTKEANLSFLGATSVVNRDDLSAPHLTVDLGGGPTELVTGDDGVSTPTIQVQDALSMNIGSVHMTGRHLTSDSPTQIQIDEVVVDVDEHIGEAFRTVDAGKARTAIGVSSTVTTMITLTVGLKKYDHTVVDGHRLNLEDAYAAGDKFLRMTRAECHEYKTIHPGRIDVVGSGVVARNHVLACVSETVKADHGEAIGPFAASEYSLLDGTVLDYGRRLLA